MINPTPQQVKQAIRAAFHEASIETFLGSYNREMTKCTGCNNQADGWNNDVGKHEPGCPYPVKVAAIAALEEWAATP